MIVMVWMGEKTFLRFGLLSWLHSFFDTIHGWAILSDFTFCIMHFYQASRSTYCSSKPSTEQLARILHYMERGQSLHFRRISGAWKGSQG